MGIRILNDEITWRRNGRRLRRAVGFVAAVATVGPTVAASAQVDARTITWASPFVCRIASYKPRGRALPAR